MTHRLAGPPLDDALMREPLVRRFFRHAERAPDTLAFALYPRGARRPTVELAWGAWSVRVRACAARMVRAGIRPGDRVAVLAGNRLMWPIVDLALQSLRAVGVGLYPSSAAAQVDALLVDSGARWIFTDDREQAARLAHHPRADGRDLHAVILDTHGDPMPVLPATAHDWRSWCDEGGDLLSHDTTIGATLDARLAAVELDDLAALIYTSGSTGTPKGACITHRYLAASAASIVSVLSLTSSDRGLSFLPFSHAAERVFGQGSRVLSGMAAALVEEPKELFAVAAHFQPTVFSGVPRLFERLFEAAEVTERDGGDPRAAITDRLGPAVRLATSGGAALPVAVAERLAGLGLPIAGAYGQTEHLCIAMNRPGRLRFDTVGEPMPGTAVMVSSDGELLVERSALTFRDYWQRPIETAEAFTADRGWLRTGDRAELLDDGALRIVGRVKELIALSNGRKVAPLPIEAALAASPFIAHAICFGEGRKYVVALLSPRRAVVEQWASARQLDRPWAELIDHPELRQQLAHHVAQVNNGLARTDQVQAFAVTADEFSTENGLLTPTMKVMRRLVEARYLAQFEALYTPRDDVPSRTDGAAAGALLASPLLEDLA